MDDLRENQLFAGLHVARKFYKFLSNFTNHVANRSGFFRVACLVIFSVAFSGYCFSQSLDLRMLRSLNKNNYPVWDNVMWGTSASIFLTMPGSVIAVGVNGLVNKDPVMQRNAYKSAITIGFATLATTTLKYSIRRTRPKARWPDEIIERDRAGALSFPSGHTTTAFATATALSLSFNKWYVTVPSYLYAGLVGYSRMRLGMHYPLDVFGGIVVGVGAGLLTWQLDRMINNK